MTTVFKHMTRENAERLLQGEIRIGSFSYYREDEHHSSIRDEHEGLTVGRTDNAVLTSSNRKETIIAGLKFVTDTGGVINVSNCSFVRPLPPLYIFSTSLLATAGHFPQYDTVVRIEDIEKFGRVIVDGRRDLFHGYWSGFVQYQERVYDAMHHPGIEPDPFIKAPKLEQDREFRLVFSPVGSVEPHVTFFLDGIREAFRSGLCAIVA